ncbi:MAG TPA: hypothetical protein VFM90_11625 [Cyclobacteriaceae bacterium]|nr:hypothetical protein [Cyclobacteriaceae bacterium]
MVNVREPLPVYGKKLLTEAEYLEFERTSFEKHEYYKSEVFLMPDFGGLSGTGAYVMSGAGYSHNVIASTILGELYAQLKGKPCHWELEEYKTPEAVLDIRFLNIRLPLHTIYERTKH